MTGHVFKRGRTWSFSVHIGYDSEGKRRRHQAGGFRTKREAERAMNEVVHRLTNKTYVSPSTKTVGDYLQTEWLPTIRNRDLKPSTYNSYESLVRLYIVPALGMDRLQDLGPGRINQFYAQLGENGRLRGGGPLAKKTIRNIHVTLRKSMADAVRWNLIPRNPCEYADPPKVRGASKRQMQTWTPDELRTFLQNMSDDRLYPAFFLAASTGLRRGEVLGVRWRDIDLENGSLSVRQSLVSIDYRLEVSPPKNGRERRLDLDSETVAVLREWKSKQNEERLAMGHLYRREAAGDLVFTKLEGGPLHPDFFSQTFDRRVAKMDLPRIRLHDLRHTHASIALVAGVDTKVISERLGHASVAFTSDIYSHVQRGLQADAAERIAAVVRGDV